MDAYQAQERFDAICLALGAKPDRRGEVWMTCPACGKEGQHFSFSERGAYCFVCGAAYGLRELAAILGIGERPADRPFRARPHPTARVERQPPPAQFAALADQYAADPTVVHRWWEYRPRLEPAIMRAYRLGCGAYPTYLSKCQHERLQVPLILEGQVVGFRGRQIDCACEKAKWLSPKGSVMGLYNGERLGKGRAPGLLRAPLPRTVEGNALFIVENPIDALLIEASTAFCAVATLGVSMWQEPWTQAVRDARPGLVWVAFDNDRPGNGGGEQGRAAWLETHEKDIVPNGVRLVNKLLEAGVSARLFPWQGYPLKTDIGDLVGGRGA